MLTGALVLHTGQHQFVLLQKHMRTVPSDAFEHRWSNMPCVERSNVD